jgi:flagellar motility protein MotE (MotC chaperone)
MARRSPPAVGGVSLIVLCFLGSAAMRLTESGAALAESRATQVQEQKDGGALENGEADRLLLALRDREAQLDAEAAQLADRAQALSVAETKLAEQLEAFETARQQLEATLAQADKAAERDIERMTAVYESMKPEEAARIFERMEVSFAAGLLARMRPEITADVLTSMEPDSAYAVTLTIASRNAAVPTE